jgi:bacillithiol system protein YtxJ
MATTFVPVETEDAWQSLRSESASQPIILFKHDPGCAISSIAHGELSSIDGEIRVVDVARDRKLSLAIADATGIRHESPQVIILRNGEPAWSASHFAIKADAVQDAVSQES